MSDEKKEGFLSGINPYVRLGLIIIAIIVVIIVIKKVLDKIEKDKQQKILENSTATTTITGANGQQVPVSVNLGTKAGAIYAKFYEYYGGLAEDEQGAITELLDVPRSLIPNLSAVYYSAYGKNLKGDFQKYCEDEWPSISYLFS